MARRLILAIAVSVTISSVARAEFDWRLPKIWPEKKAPSQSLKKKSKVQPAGAWMPFDSNSMGQAKKVVNSPVKLFRRMSDGTRDLFDRTRTAVASPFQDTASLLPEPKFNEKKSSFFSNPFSKSKDASKTKNDGPDSVTEFLSQKRPGFDRR